MEKKFLQNNWYEMRCQISDWWDELTDEDLDRIDGNQEKLIRFLQERYGYTRNMAFVEVKIRMSNYCPEGKEKEIDNHLNKDLRDMQYSSYGIDDWLEIKNSQAFAKSRTKARVYENIAN